MKIQQPNNDNIRRKLEFVNEENNKPKRQTTNIHMFLNQHQQKPRNIQSDSNLLLSNMSVNKTSIQLDNTINTSIPSNSTTSNTSPRNKDSLPQPELVNNEQIYAGGGYSKSPDPKSLGKPSLKTNSPPKINTITTSSSSQSSGNVIRFDAESFFKNANNNNNLIRSQSNIK